MSLFGVRSFYACSLPVLDWSVVPLYTFTHTNRYVRVTECRNGVFIRPYIYSSNGISCSDAPSISLPDAAKTLLQLLLLLLLDIRRSMIPSFRRYKNEINKNTHTKTTKQSCAAEFFGCFGSVTKPNEYIT